MTDSRQSATQIRVTLRYDLVIVGETIVSGDLFDLERWRETSIVLKPDTDIRIRCGLPFCQRGERPLSVEATRWEIRLERVTRLARVE